MLWGNWQAILLSFQILWNLFLINGRNVEGSIKPQVTESRVHMGCITTQTGPLSSAVDKALAMDVISEVLSQAQLETTYFCHRFVFQGF